MKMQLFETLKLKFEKADWALNPAFGLIDTVIESHPELLKIIEPDILQGSKQSCVAGKQITSRAKEVSI